MKPYWMGLDIGGTKCAVLLATVDGGIHLKDKLRFETQSERGFEPVYAQLTETMDEILRKNGLTYADLNAVGVSCGGPLDSRRGVVLCPPNLPGWVNIPLKAMLEERCGVPVYVGSRNAYPRWSDTGFPGRRRRSAAGRNRAR